MWLDAISETPEEPKSDINKEHPEMTAEEIRATLTPEQQEIFDAITDFDEKDHAEMYEDALEETSMGIDPVTGEEIQLELKTIEDFGFVKSPRAIELTMEAFHNDKLEHIQSVLIDRIDEITSTYNNLKYKGTISRQEANNINTMLGGLLQDKVILESFTNIDSRTNYKFVMEELATKENALIAGAAIVGVAILYKLLKWLFKGWGDNDKATGALGKYVNDVKSTQDKLKNSPELIKTAVDNIKAELEHLKKHDSGTTAAEVKRSVDLARAWLKALADKGDDMKLIHGRMIRNNDIGALAISYIYGEEVDILLNETGVKVDWLKIGANGGTLNKAMVAAKNAIEASEGLIDTIIKTSDSDIFTIEQSLLDDLTKSVGVYKEFAVSFGFKQAEAGGANNKAGFDHTGLHKHIKKFLDSSNVDYARVEQYLGNDFNPDPNIESIFGIIDDAMVKNIEEILTKIDELKKRRSDKSGDNKLTSGNASTASSKINNFDLATKMITLACWILRIALDIRNSLGKAMHHLNTELNKISSGTATQN